MGDTKIVKAYCNKTKKYYGLEVRKVGLFNWEVVNMVDLSLKESKILASEVKQKYFNTHKNLVPCFKCGSRRVGGCDCAKTITDCKPDMKYKFQCIYCKEFIIDYSLPKRSDVIRYGGGDGKVTISQGKEVHVVKFDDEGWIKFDNVKVHPHSTYIEHRHHVIATDENIEFHGYHVSEMDEGVYYEIEPGDDFEIECSVNTSKISPHPGGFFYVDFGIITAHIDQNGGEFLLEGRPVSHVGNRFKMKLSLTDGCHYEIYINDTLVAEKSVQVSSPTRITFGFKHGGHCCDLLSHAFIKGIKMKQGYKVPEQ